MAVLWQVVPTSVFAMLFTPDLQDVRLMPSVSSMLLAAAPQLSTCLPLSMRISLTIPCMFLCSGHTLMGRKERGPGTISQARSCRHELAHDRSCSSCTESHLGQR